MPMMTTQRCFAASLIALAVTALAAGLTSTPAQAGPPPVLRFESNSSGELAVVARGVTIMRALNAVAEQAQFEVLVQEGAPRPPLNVTVLMAPIDDVVREMLSGRNYALVYDGDSGSLSQVILLAPSVPGKPSAAARRRNVPARRTASKKPRGALVVRN